MRFKFNPDTGVRELYTEGKKSRLSRKIGPDGTKGFALRMKVIADAADEPGLRAFVGLHYEKLERSDYERSIRLTGKWRLICWPMEDVAGRYLWIDLIEDYHDDRVGKKK